jgi:dimethylhistidine N-methyltransferase
MNSMPALRNRYRFIDRAPAVSDACSDILAGLSQPRKCISPRFFYDDTGSALFEEITRQPEYYPTRTERQLLHAHAGDIAAALPSDCTLLEPGAGSCEKVRLLLDDIRPACYVPMDIAGGFLCQAADSLCREYPWLPVTAIAAEFNQFSAVDEAVPARNRVVFYPGSTLGNFSPQAATTFLSGIRTVLGEDGHLLIGVDMHKDADVLNAAYNDRAGITARFNLNALAHINRVAQADFDLDDFEHLAFYNGDQRRIEMHLRCRRAHRARCAGQHLDFAAGETIHTEYSHKYTVASFKQLVKEAGLAVTRQWQDDKGWFSVFLCQPA